METQYLIPGADFHDEQEDGGQYLDPGQTFIDEDATATATRKPVIFVCTS